MNWIPKGQFKVVSGHDVDGTDQIETCGSTIRVIRDYKDCHHHEVNYNLWPPVKGDRRDELNCPWDPHFIEQLFKDPTFV
jgi:hypothetical protein